VPRTGKRRGPSWTSAPSLIRLAAMVAVAVATSLGTGFAGDWRLAPLVGWDAAALLFLVVVWVAITPMGSAATAEHATRENPGRAASDVIILCSAVASLVGVGVVLVRANSATGAERNWLAGLGVASVALSWFAVHTLFTLRYALLYYTGPDQGIDFKQNVPPRYLDFAYVSFTIGMTFQISDTDLRNPGFRATALRHALLSYLFGAVILASMINLVAGLGSQH
jgi:uncharacterized membrane protein